MATLADPASGTVHMSADEENRYELAYKCIGQFRADITKVATEVKRHPPKPVPGSCARLRGGMGSRHMGGAACLWDTHNPNEPDGNKYASCRWSHSHWDSTLEPTDADILGAVSTSDKGNSLHELLCD